MEDVFSITPSRTEGVCWGREDNPDFHTDLIRAAHEVQMGGRGMHAWKTEKRKKEMKNSAVLLVFALNFFLLQYPSEKGAISASQTVTSIVNNCFIDFLFKNKF